MSEILFICEHGSAKSIVAAAHFNRLAADNGLSLRAISRGTDPDSEVHPGALAGLKADGLTAPDEPQKLAPADLTSAKTIISFSQLGIPGEVWTVPAVSENYPLARNAIVERVTRMIQSLKKST